jgi:xanthine dehydrogenase YagS FAD-binding subunit
MRDRVFPVAKIVSITDVDDLRGIRRTPTGGLRIGALTTISEIAGSDLIRDRYAGLATAAGDVASPQLRNQGTLGGNLCQRPRCWYFRGEFHCLKKGGNTCYAESGENRYHAIMGGTPCYIVHPSDTAPMLMAFDASVRIQGEGTERTIGMDSFFVLPDRDVSRETSLAQGELVTGVDISDAPDGTRSLYRKVRERGSWDFALASVAVVLRMEGNRVAKSRLVLGGVAPIPWRLPAVENLLEGQPITAALAEEAGRLATQGAEPLEQNGYKVRLVEGIVEESLLALA